MTEQETKFEAAAALLIGLLGLLMMVAFALNADAKTSDKVTICHVPPGNTENVQQIEVDPEGWNGHRLHDLDYEGPCLTTTSSASTSEPETTSTSTTVPDTTTTVPDTTTSTIPETTTTTIVTTTAPPSTVPTTTTAPTTTQPSTTVPPTTMPTTSTTTPAPPTTKPAPTTNRLADTGTTYDVLTLVLAALILTLLGIALARCSKCNNKTDQNDPTP